MTQFMGAVLSSLAKTPVWPWLTGLHCSVFMAHTDLPLFCFANRPCDHSQLPEPALCCSGEQVQPTDRALLTLAAPAPCAVQSHGFTCHGKQMAVPSFPRSLTAHSSSLLCRAFRGEFPWGPTETNQALISASRISPCQVKELELLGGFESLLQPQLGCGALCVCPWTVCAPTPLPSPALCPGSHGGWWGTGLPLPLLGLLPSPTLHGLELFTCALLAVPRCVVLLSESVWVSQRERGRKQVLAHGVSCRFHGCA